MLIFGESALNDAVAIILYRFFVSLQSEKDNLGVWPFILSIVASFFVFFGSVIVGVVIALFYAKITKHVWIHGYEGAIYEMIMLYLFAYASYLLAEILDLTGIISIFFTGITIAHYATPNMTELTKKTVKVRLCNNSQVSLRVICMLFEGFIFLYFGLGLMSFGVSYDFLFVFFAIVSIILAYSRLQSLSEERMSLSFVG
jgi:sodium/hydrogen exchanger 8